MSRWGRLWRWLFPVPRRVVGWTTRSLELVAFHQYLAGHITRDQYLKAPGGTVTEPIYEDDHAG